MRCFVITLNAMKILCCLVLALAVSSLAWAKDEEPPKPALKPEMVKADAFKNRYLQVGMAQTVHHTEFVGVVDGVAILKVGDMNLLTKGWREKWIGVKLADLDPVFRAEVEKAAAVIRAKQEAEEKARLEAEAKKNK